MKPEQETVIDRAQRLAEVRACDYCKQAMDRPDLRGTSWAKKDGSSPYYSISFSITLLEIAGGIDRLLEEWEQKV